MLTPFTRELCLLHGWHGVSRHTLLARLRQGPGSAVGIWVGGAAEAVYAEVCGARAGLHAWHRRCSRFLQSALLLLLPSLARRSNSRLPAPFFPGYSRAQWTWSCLGARGL